MTSDCRAFGLWAESPRFSGVVADCVAAGCHQRMSSSGMAALCKVRSELHLYAAPALEAEFISWTLRRHTRRLLLRQQGRCGVTFSDCCCGSRDVAASYSRLLLRQQGRCGVILEDCCCGSRDVAASHSQTAVAAAETLQLPELSAEHRWSQCRPSIDCKFQNVEYLRTTAN